MAHAALLAAVILMSGLLGFLNWRWSRQPEVPVGFGPAANASVVFSAPNNRYFYDRIVKELPEGPPVEFLLVCSDDPPTFYIMKHKVWNALFAQFAAQHPTGSGTGFTLDARSELQGSAGPDGRRLPREPGLSGDLRRGGTVRRLAGRPPALGPGMGQSGRPG